jgi:hypothetical protein
MHHEHDYQVTGELAGDDITWVKFDDGEGDYEEKFNDIMQVLCSLDPTLKMKRYHYEPDWAIVNRRLSADELSELSGLSTEHIHDNKNTSNSSDNNAVRNHITINTEYL